MSVVLLSLKPNFTDGFAVMNPHYADPACKCTPTKVCVKHAILAHQGFVHRQALQPPHHTSVPSRPFTSVPGTAPRVVDAHDQSSSTPDNAMASRQRAWNLAYGNIPTPDAQLAASLMQSSGTWDHGLDPLSLQFSSSLQHSARPSPNPSVPSNTMLQAPPSQLVQQTNTPTSPYYDAYGAAESPTFPWVASQQWAETTDLPQQPYWTANVVPSHAMRHYSDVTLHSTSSGPEEAMHGGTDDSMAAQTTWRSASISSAGGQYGQSMISPMSTYMPLATPGTPPRYWMVRSDARVMEENGSLSIELDGTAGARERERVPAARFEDVFQDALQDNRTSPETIRASWQVRTDGGKSTITYVGPVDMGINKTRKSTVFCPFISVYKGQYCVMLVDDTDGSGSMRPRALRSSPYLPDTMSTREAGWLIEAILRRDWTITIEDIMDRMLSRIRLDISTYNRWRRHDKAIYEFEDEPRSRY